MYGNLFGVISAMTKPCWSCQHPVPDGGPVLFCPACQALQAPDLHQDLFALFGLLPGFTLEVDEVEQRYRALQQRTHPDRFALASKQEQQYALAWTTRLNDGYRMLRDPVARAGYLLEQHARQHGREVAPAHAPEPAFLAVVMEWRERLEEVAVDQPGAAGVVQALRTEARGELVAEVRCLEQYFTRTDAAPDPLADPDTVAGIARCLGRLSYRQRLLAEIERLEEQIDELAG